VPHRISSVGSSSPDGRRLSHASASVKSIGRVLIAQGRDAADVPIAHTFGRNTLVSFKVWTDEVT